MGISKIYFDMDGVLADFGRGVRELCGMEPPPQDGSSPELDDERWARIRDAGHFYDRLELMPGARELFDDIRKKYGNRCEILTAVPKEKRKIETAAQDKTNWVRRLLSPDIQINVCLRAEKLQKCTGGDAVLIDDLRKNIHEWEEAGGTGILYVDAQQARKELEGLGLL